MKKATFVFCGLAALVIAAAGCSDVKRKPGKVYMPDMAYSRAYETYSTNPVFADDFQPGKRALDYFAGQRVVSAEIRIKLSSELKHARF